MAGGIISSNDSSTCGPRACRVPKKHLGSPSHLTHPPQARAGRGRRTRRTGRESNYTRGDGAHVRAGGQCPRPSSSRCPGWRSISPLCAIWRKGCARDQRGIVFGEKRPVLCVSVGRDDRPTRLSDAATTASRLQGRWIQYDGRSRTATRITHWPSRGKLFQGRRLDHALVDDGLARAGGDVELLPGPTILIMCGGTIKPVPGSENFSGTSARS